MKQSAPDYRKKFTLIELLVTIAIIAIRFAEEKLVLLNTGNLT